MTNQVGMGGSSRICSKNCLHSVCMALDACNCQGEITVLTSDHERQGGLEMRARRAWKHTSDSVLAAWGYCSRSVSTAEPGSSSPKHSEHRRPAARIYAARTPTIRNCRWQRVQAQLTYSRIRYRPRDTWIRHGWANAIVQTKLTWSAAARENSLPVTPTKI